MLINNSKAPLCAIDNCRTIANHCIWTKLLIRSTTKQNGIFYDLICVISEVCLGLTSDMTYGGADGRIVLPWQAKCKKRTHTDFISVFCRSSCCVSRSILQWLRVFVKPSSSGITIISRLFFWGLDSWPFQLRLPKPIATPLLLTTNLRSWYRKCIHNTLDSKKQRKRAWRDLPKLGYGDRPGIW